MSKTLRRGLETLESRLLLAADLSVRFAPLPAEANATDPLSYVAHVRNEGPDDAVGARVEIGGLPLESVSWSRQGPHSFPADLALQHLDGSNGVIFRDIQLSSVGDLNNDGLGDFSATDADGQAFVLFGDAQLSPSIRVDPQTLDGRTGFRLQGFDEFAQGASAGDVDGDGIDDLLFGAHVVLGGADIGTNGEVRAGFTWQVTRAPECARCGRVGRTQHVAAGDVNGDGYDDILVSDPTVPHTPVIDRGEVRTYREADIGSAWVLWGGPRATRRLVLLDRLRHSDGFQIRPDTNQTWEFGTDAMPLGDINQDGFDDVMIVDYGRPSERGVETTVYLVYGKPDFESRDLLIDPIEGADGVTRLVHRSDHDARSNRIYNPSQTMRLIDLNNDGYQDLLLDSLVMYGDADGFAFQQAVPDALGVIDIATLDGVETFLPWYRLPIEFGDLNHDGELDLLLRDMRDRLFDDGVENNGAVYVAFGDGSARPFNLQIDEYDGGKGTRMLGWLPDMRVGESGDFIDDVNGDGIEDLLISGGYRGDSYLVYGSRSYRSTRAGEVGDVIDVPAGEEVTYTISGHLPAEGPPRVQATATVTLHGDSMPTNNTANSNVVVVKERLPPSETDLVVQMENSNSIIFPGQQATYTVTVRNATDTFAAQAQVRVQLDESLGDVSWKRLDTGQQGTGNIDETVDVPPDVQLTYRVAYTASRQVGSLMSMASATVGQHQTDSNTLDNSVTVTSQAPLRPQYPHYLGDTTPCFDDTAITGGSLYYVGWSFDECYITRAQASSGFYGGHLWKTDGTRSGTRQVRRFTPAAMSRAEPVDGFIDPDLTEFQGAIYFAADDVSTGQELWRTDGTEAGTYVVKDIVSGLRMEPGYLGIMHEVNPDSDVDNLGALSDYLLFSADDEVYGRELWRTDGTEAGTVLVKDINPGKTHSFERKSFRGEPKRTLVYDNVYYFIADDGMHGRELWRSDGTDEGTYLLKDIAAGGESAFQPKSHPSGELGPLRQPRFRVRDGLLYFYEYSTNPDGRLWRTDGTSEGTRPADSPDVPSDDRLIVDGIVVTFDNGAFYGQPVDGGERQLLATWHTDSKFEPAWMRSIGDRVIFSTGQDNLFDEGQTYSFSTKTDSVQIIAPPVVQVTGTPELQQHGATEVLEVQELSDEVLSEVSESYRVERGYRVDASTEWMGGMASPTDVLGNTRNEIGLLPGESITLGFPGLIVDGDGYDISFVDLYWAREVRVEGIDQSGKIYNLGRRFNGEIDLERLGLSDVSLAAFRITAIGRATDEPKTFTSVLARTNAEVVLTASSPMRPDLQFSWDLNNDGVFGDRVGRSIGLTRADLAQFGMVQAGAYPVRVRMNDRVTDYYDEAIIQIAGEFAADVNGDQRLTFADFLLLRENYGIADAEKTDGDLDNDGRVTFRDFLILSSHFRFIEP